ncbi:MAG: zf-HC2 domain-containing protein [Pseudonocardiaceae bacterium]
MTELSCRQCNELAAELALGVLPGVERARVLAHLSQCATCANTVSSLTLTVDRLIELLPDAEPPAGFEQRALTALGPPAPRVRRWWLPAAAVIIAIALVGAGWTLGRATVGVAPLEVGATPRTVLFAPLTSAGKEVGQAFLYPGQPAWIYMSLDTDTDTASGTVRCELVRRDGSTVQIGTFHLAKGYAAWGGPADIDRDSLATARVIDSAGAVLATARFAS